MAAGLTIIFALKLVPLVDFIVGLAVALLALGTLVVSAKTFRAEAQR